MLHRLIRYRLLRCAVLHLAASSPLLLLLVAATPISSALVDDVDTAPDPRLSGGDTTIFDASSAAFEAPAPNLSDEDLVLHTDGDLAFWLEGEQSDAATAKCRRLHSRHGRHPSLLSRGKFGPSVAI